MIREADELELDYIYSTWAHSAISRHRSKSIRVRSLICQINDALENARTLVDLRPGERVGGDVVGWICYTPLQSTGIVHWVYVRKLHRRQGVGRGLCRAAGIDLGRLVGYTSDSTTVDSVLRDIPQLKTTKVSLKDVIT